MISSIKRTRISAWALCLALLLAGCGGGGGGGGGGSTPPVSQGATLKEVLSEPLGEETNCPNLAFSANRGVPGENILVDGLPANMGEISFRVMAEDLDGEPVIDPLFVRVDDKTGEISFVVPVHPLRDPEGGQVHLEAGDGDLHCPVRSFAIDPLPPAPLDYPVTLASDLEAWADAVLVALGHDPQVLLEADPDTLPEARLDLWLVKQFVSGDREDSLPVVAKQAEEENNELVARLLKASGLEQVIDQALNDVNATAAARLKLRPLVMSTTKRKRLVREGDPGIATQTTSRLSTDCQEQAFDPDELQIDTAAELSARLLAGKAGYLFDGSTSGRALGGAALADVKNTGNAAGVVGTSVFAVATLEGAKRALEPQRITSFQVKRAGGVWIEDRDPSDLLFWDGATVQAEGSEFNVGEATLQSLVVAVGMVPGPVGTATTAATTVAPDGINDAIAELTGDSCIKISAPHYGPINVDDSQWTRVQIEGSTIELAGDGHRQYRGVDIGASTLHINLEEAPFALAVPMRESFIVDVKKVRTSLIPSSVNVTAPGEIVDLAATAGNAHEQANRSNFTASLPEGKGVIMDQQENGDFHEVMYESPQNRDDFPTVVRFTANHPTLPPGELRERDVTVDLGGEVTISPRNACLQPGTSMTFSAGVAGFTQANESVNWTASAGTIQPTGSLEASYQAPAGTGTVEITATAAADNSIKDTVTITIDSHCIRKKWWPLAGLSMDGNGTYSSGMDGCPPDLHDDMQTEEAIDEHAPTSIAAMLNAGDYWYDRAKRISAHFGHSSQRYRYDSNLDQCSQVGLFGSHVGGIDYIAQGDGTLAASFDSEITAYCENYSDGEAECSGGVATMGLGTGVFYLTLEEERRYQLKGQLSCSGLEGHVSIIPVTGQVARYVNGQPWTPPQGTTGVRNPNGTMRSPQLFSVTCTQSNETIPIDVDFVLDAPPQGETHEILIHLTGEFQTRPHLHQKTGFGPPGTGFDTQPTAPPNPGEYVTNANIDFSVKLSPN